MSQQNVDGRTDIKTLGKSIPSPLKVAKISSQLVHSAILVRFARTTIGTNRHNRHEPTQDFARIHIGYMLLLYKHPGLAKKMAELILGVGDTREKDRETKTRRIKRAEKTERTERIYVYVYTSSLGMSHAAGS